MQKRSQFLHSLAIRAFIIAAGLAVGAAQARDLDPETRNYVIATCSTDAYRLCPQSLSNEQAAVSCMRARRRELGSACRVAYDRVARILAH